MTMLRVAFIAAMLAVAAAGNLGADGHGTHHSKPHGPPGPGPHPGPPRPGPPGPPGPGPHPGPPGPEMVCKRDFMRFCAFRVEDMANFDEIIVCMKSHDAELSPECKEHVDEVSEMLLGFHAACDASLTSFQCDVTNPHSYKPCIVEHLPDLSHDCLAKISEIMQKHHKPPGPPAPPPPMVDADWSYMAMPQQEPAMMMYSDYMGEWEGEGKHHGKAHVFMSGVAGALTTLAVLFCAKKCCHHRRNGGKCCMMRGNNQQPMMAQCCQPAASTVPTMGHPVTAGHVVPQKSDLDYHALA